MLKEIEANLELIKSGQNFLGILNDIKRRPDDYCRFLYLLLSHLLSYFQKAFCI